jgi:ATP-dependent helicase/nuclease subunit A
MSGHGRESISAVVIDVERQGGQQMSSRLLIRASAGTGKTFRLSGHFLQQLFLGAKPETILATTFTRKAAGEILGRVLLRLAHAASDDAEASKLAQFLSLPGVDRTSALRVLADLTHNLHRVRVCTLDSFFQQMARSLSLELGLPAGWSIIDEWMEADLKQQAIDAVLAGHTVGDARDMMYRLSKDRSKRSVRDLIADTVESFYSIYLITSESAWKIRGGGKPLTQSQRETAIRELYAMALPTDQRFIKARAEDVERFETESWDDFLRKGIATKVFNNEDQFFRKQISQEVEAAYSPLIEHAKSQVIGQLARQNATTWDLISRFDHEYVRLQEEHGWLRFSDVTRSLAHSDATVDGERMAFRLDQSIQHLLLDEFQDTSPDQWRILKSLTTALITGESTNTFFCVGDPKQAIYGWRGGEAAILDAVETTVPELSSEPLDKSRRSSPVVIETVNRIFQHVADHANLGEYSQACQDWVKAFPSHDTALEALPGYVRFATAPQSDGESISERKSDYIPWVAQQIKEMHQQHPGLQIGVLTRKNDTVARLVHALAALGVAASEEGGTPPVDSPAVLAVLSLLHMSSHPGCTVSRFHVATSRLAKCVGLVNWQDDDQASRVAADMRSRLLDDGYGTTLQRISKAVQPCCNRRDILRLQQIVAAAWQFDDSPSLNPCDFVRLLEGSRIGSSDEAAVRVMTVHQSKGLEFDVVVLPELDSALVRTPSAAVGRVSPDELPDRVCIWRNKELLAMLPLSLQDAFQQTRDRQMTEALCLLYVALTRAAHSLHLLAMPVTSTKLPRTFQGLLVASLTEDQTADANKTLYDAGDPNWYRHVRGAELPSRAVSRAESTRPQLALQPMIHGRQRGLTRRAPSRHDDTRLFFHSGKRSRHVECDPLTRGTVMHAWLECITWLGQDERPDPHVLRARTAELSLPDSTINTLLPEFYAFIEQSEVRDALTQSAALASPAFRDMKQDIQSGLVQLTVHSERSFALLKDNAVVQGTIDRLVLAVRGDKVVAADVLDYKTDRLAGDRSDWIDGRIAQYRSQLHDYRRAVMHCFSVPEAAVATRLVLLEADAVVSV